MHYKNTGTLYQQRGLPQRLQCESTEPGQCAYPQSFLDRHAIVAKRDIAEMGLLQCWSKGAACACGQLLHISCH